MFMLLLSLLTPNAHAFCGTYVGHAGAELYNNVSQVALVRDGRRTTLTLANDYEGDARDFALVIPVPEVLREGDVRVIDSAVFASLDAYSSPRLVEYTCDDAYPTQWAAGESSACTGSSPSEAPLQMVDGVVVESAFEAGEYDISVLSAQQSAGLFDWLDARGYQPHPDARELLQEYIDQDLYFLTAQVRVASVGKSQLSPLQLSYEADDLVLPIRIGTASSKGTQDVIVYAVNARDDGSMAIANYPRLEVEDECMAIVDGDGLGEYYAGAYDRLTADEPASWTVEYSWQPVKCDPCVGPPPASEDFETLGWERDAANAHFTRIHARYDAASATEDLLLYSTGDTSSSQIRFIRYAEPLEDLYPVCGLGMLPEPGSCWDDDEWRARRQRRASAPSPLWLLGLFAGVAIVGRRRHSMRT